MPRAHPRPPASDTGEIAQCAAADIRAALPNCRILFASVMLDVLLENLPDVASLIAARRTNERRTLSHETAQRRGVSDDVYIFPSEELDEQWEQIQAAQSPTRLESCPSGPSCNNKVDKKQLHYIIMELAQVGPPGVGKRSKLKLGRSRAIALVTADAL